jgi:hypothetical protein
MSKARLIGIFDNSQGAGVAAECPDCPLVVRESTERQLKKVLTAHGPRAGHGWTSLKFKRYPGAARSK